MNFIFQMKSSLKIIFVILIVIATVEGKNYLLVKLYTLYGKFCNGFEKKNMKQELSQNYVDRTDLQFVHCNFIFNCVLFQ